MQGKIKWFSKEKGYGFICSDEGVDHYFSVRDVQGADLPVNADIVSFESHNGPKGSRATSVVILARLKSQIKQDDRVTCPHCKKKMVPRLITFQGSVTHTVCPFCAETYRDFRSDGPCFIATAIYGDYDAPEVVRLRQFRDRALLPSRAGRLLVRGYYRLSPPLARYLVRHPRLSARLKPLLDALTRRLG
ncbi:cold-shock protein [Pseudomonas luteola]|uniref:Cold shock domain-containing protein n=1 Tax=Pseudomonas luteola TaxID=47886 RepID=A0ABS0MYF3_PSELU|nr:cold shock domain-containing protein [Pseudomonas zeshuii]MBH3441485.1 cold shock domain-containing protein [Pseudomonas luteola]RRW40521.1 cold shock domain-containing protein [Pseudomonas luteola]RRW43144.1 cold shock domain-containing protein [Pseudomonas luteola]